MNSKSRKCFLSIAVFVSLVVTNLAPLPRVTLGQTPGKPTLEQKAMAKRIQERTRITDELDNGIFVDTPKVYDDSSLQLMLNAARARLASIQALDQAGLLSKIGAVTGASLSQSGFSAQVMGPPIPQIATTAPGATLDTTAISGGTTTTKTTVPGETTVTTNPSMSASAPAIPQGSVGLPSSGYSVSALDALSEQMQLTYEIANLQLLLEGSLNDRYVQGQHIVKPRTTIGFPITITPHPSYKNAVAVVEVEISNPPAGTTLSDEPPTVTALLPREKTYNVAAVSDRMTSIGGGVVTQVINGGFSYLKGRKSYYVVQDQDTVALMRSSSDKTNAAAFSWEFRPVLGQSFVRAGMKQTFVQLSAPILQGLSCFGGVKITTYWRHVDRKTGVLKDVIPESISIEKPRDIPNFDLTPVIIDTTYDDLGAGQIRVSVMGDFLSGTYVRVGSNYLRDGSPGFTSELTQIRFVAAAADVAKYKAYLVKRDGQETEILSGGDPDTLQPLLPCGLKKQVGDAQFVVDVAPINSMVHPGETATYKVTVTGGKGFSKEVSLALTDLPKEIESSTRSKKTTVTPGSNSAVSVTVDVATTNQTSPGALNFNVFASSPGYETKKTPATVFVVREPGKGLTASVTAYDDSRSIVEAVLIDKPQAPTDDKYLMIISDKVFGLADAPIQRRRNSNNSLVLRAVVPNSLLNGSNQVEVKPLFWKEYVYATTAALPTSPIESAAEKLVILNKTEARTVFILYGSRLRDASILIPQGVQLGVITADTTDTRRLFSLTADQLLGLKQIVLKKGKYERPVFVSLPESSPKAVLTVGGRVVAGTDEVVVTGDIFDGLKTVKFGKKPITKVAGETNKSVKLTGLVGADVTKSPGKPELTFEFEDGRKNVLKLEVINSKVETVDRDKP